MSSPFVLARGGFVLMMRFIGFPTRWCSLSVFGLGGCIIGGRVIGECVVGRNAILACCRASLIVIGAVLNFILNYCGVRICLVVGFWIWVIEVFC